MSLLCPLSVRAMWYHKETAGTTERSCLSSDVRIMTAIRSQKPQAPWQPGLWEQPEKEASPEARSEPSEGRLLEKEVLTS